MRRAHGPRHQTVEPAYLAAVRDAPVVFAVDLRTAGELAAEAGTGQRVTATS